MEGDYSVIIIGAGAAGLAAAGVFAAEGISAIVLEARERPGGRIFTVPGCVESMPVELGAEFIHGAKNDTWQIIRIAKLKTHELPDRHWMTAKGKLSENKNFWDELSEA